MKTNAIYLGYNFINSKDKAWLLLQQGISSQRIGHGM